MPSQLSPAPSVSNTAAVYLAVAAVSAFALAVLIYVDLFTLLVPARAAAGLLAAACSIGGVGYISRSAEDRIERRRAVDVALILDRIDRVEQRMDAHAANLTEQGENNLASVFVAGAAGSRHLASVPRQG